jgi:hypothetical protein
MEVVTVCLKFLGWSAFVAFGAGFGFNHARRLWRSKPDQENLAVDRFSINLISLSFHSCQLGRATPQSKLDQEIKPSRGWD